MTSTTSIQAAPHYDRGQIGALFSGSYELDPSAAPTAGVWDWTNTITVMDSRKNTFPVPVTVQ